MYAIVAGGGKVGTGVLRRMLRLGHEATLIEQRRDRFERLEEEFEHQVLHGDATELYVLEQAGIERPPDLVIAVTGDDEDNIVIGQVARERYGVPKVIARVNDPRNQKHFDLLGIAPTVSATVSIMALVEHEVPEHDLVQLLELRNENLEIVEVQIDRDDPCTGKTIAGIRLPEGARLISVVRDGKAVIAGGDDRAQGGRPGARDSRAGPGGRAAQGADQAVRRLALGVAAVLVAALPGCGLGEDEGAGEATTQAAPATAQRSCALDPPRGERARVAGARRRRRAASRAGSTSSSRRDASSSSRTAASARSRSSTSGRSSAPAASRASCPSPSTRSTRRTGASTSTTPTATAHTNVVEYRSNGTRAIPGTARRLLFVRQPYANHNGGQVVFGPDGRLYVGMGDGGAGGDPENRAQDMGTLLGKLVSINVATQGREDRGARPPQPVARSRSTGAPATSGSATSARTRGRRSTSCRAGARASRTTAGTPTRGARGSRTSRSRAGGSSSRSPSTAGMTAARSRAGSSPAARSPRRAGATSTATTARAPSGA